MSNGSSGAAVATPPSLSAVCPHCRELDGKLFLCPNHLAETKRIQSLARGLHPSFKYNLEWEIKKWVIQWAPKSLLDVGTARGDMLYNAHRVPTPPARQVGIDWVDTTLPAARVMNPQATFQVADVRHLPFAEDEFDMVMSHGCLIHIHPDDIDQAITEIFRVGHKALLIESSCDHLASREKVSDELAHRYWKMRSRYYSVTMMSERLQKRIMKIPYYRSHPYPALFAQHGLFLESALCLDEPTQTFAYAVRRKG